MTDIIKRFRSIDFTVVQEPWNLYRGEDGSLLGIKYIVNRIFILVTEDGTEEFKINGDIRSTVRSVPDHFRITPTFKKEVINIQKADIIENVDFDIEKENWNKYQFFWKDKMSTLKIKASMISALKTKYFDDFGLPIYQLNYSTAISINPDSKLN